MTDSEIIYGLHAVDAAIRYQPEQIQELWVDRNRKDGKMLALLKSAKANNISVQMLSRKDLDTRLPDTHHQGVTARIQSKPTRNEKDLQNLLERIDGDPFLLILDGVQDPHNLGACLRSADAVGVHAVIVPKDKAVGLTPTVHKVACGAAESVPLIQVTNLARTLRSLKDAGIWLTGLGVDAEQEIFERDLKGPLALVLGAEGKGLRKLTREHCDFLAKIPMHGMVDSLNVSVATGIVLFEALRQRGREKIKE